MSLETAIIIATLLVLTLPIGWWIQRSANPSEGPRVNPAALTPEARAALVTQLRVFVMRGEARSSEAERVVLATALKELRREGLSPAHLDQLSDGAMSNLWVCERVAFGNDQEAAAVLANLPADARTQWSRVRTRVKRERRQVAQREAETDWVKKHPDQYDRLTKLAEGSSAIVRWLSDQGPAEWHVVGLQLSPDRVGYAPLQWLAEQKNLDRATAIGLFLGAKPEVALGWKADEVSGPRRDRMKLLRTLASRLAEDRFEHRAFLQPASRRSAYFSAQTKALTARGELPWTKLPGHALGPMRGRDVSCDYFVEGSVVRKRVDLGPHVSGQRRG